LLKKKCEIDEEIEKHQQKFPCLEGHHKIIHDVMQTMDNNTASLSDATHPTSITNEVVETSSVTTAATTD